MISSKIRFFDNFYEKSSDNIYITTIIEISEKYGIGYELSNKNIGVLFNDKSHITKFNGIKNLVYYVSGKERKKIFLPLKSKEKEISKDLNNKLYYLGYIISELKKIITKKNEGAVKPMDLFDIYENKDYFKDNVYLTKYKKNNYAYYFILSNKSIQINFFDGTNIIFVLSQYKKIIYINKDGTKVNYELKRNQDFSEFRCDNSKINKKIKYALKEIKK